MSFSDIESNLEAVRRRISQACQRAGRSVEEVTLIAVTKTVDAAAVQTAVSLGLRDLGENRVQEASRKIQQLAHLQPRPTWHLIGHLQSNKVGQALELFNIIHSVDSLKLAENLQCRAKKKVSVLLQVNVAGESTKSGFSIEEIETCFPLISRMPNLCIKGLMTIAPIVEDPEEVRPIFRKLREMRDALHLEHMSMGMTDDFEVAIEEGATFVRVGRAIFGERK